ncbi:MAG: class I SAM-dependent methyltransferase [Spirochaetaceae bacterium]|nr:MAG: class I SAM-dependent methyltransferase [Spirochaetaceae bacterium]
MAETPDTQSPWDARFAGTDYIYGTEANAWVVEALQRYPAIRGGRALELACGEGRNAVYLAEQGYAVTAVDSSPVGLEKTRALAQSRGVSVKTVCADALAWRAEEPFDLVVATWFHVAPERKQDLFRTIREAVRPGGVLIAEWFHPEQRLTGLTSGGPPDPAMMFTVEELQAGLPDFTFDSLTHAQRTISEGPKHSGPASIISLAAKRT